jgi:AraC-like DNA-binding protein
MTLLQFATRPRASSVHATKPRRTQPTIGSAADFYGDLAKINVTSTDETPLDLDLSLRLIPETAVAAIQTSACLVERTKAQVADGDDGLVLVFVLEGDAMVRQAGRDDTILRKGEAYLYLNDKPHATAVSPGTASLHISMPRTWFDRSAAGIDAALKGKLAPTPERDLLNHYARLLTMDNPLPPALATVTAGHLRDLATLSLNPTRDAGRNAWVGGGRAARFMAVKMDIAANLNHSDLSLDWLAGRHGLSVRGIRNLFYMSGTSFTDHVREERLRRAHTLLTDSAQDNRSIAAIAFAAGFGDLSWFNQSFRQRYGLTPSDMRRRHRATGK